MAEQGGLSKNAKPNFFGLENWFLLVKFNKTLVSNTNEDSSLAYLVFSVTRYSLPASASRGFPASENGSLGLQRLLS